MHDKRPLEEENEFGIWPGYAVYDHTDGVEIPIIKGLINKGDFVLIQAEEGVGKSVLGQQWKFNLTMGKAFLDIFDVSRKYTVLWNMSESKKRKYVRRIKDMKKSMELDDDYWWFNNCNNCFLDTAEGTKNFIKRAEAIGHPVDIMFFDSLYGFYAGNFNDNEAAKTFCANARYISGKYDSTMVFLHHKNKDSYASDGSRIDKGSRPTGAWAWGAFFTTIYTLKKNKTMHYLENNKDRDGDAVTSIPMFMNTPQKCGKLEYTTDIDELNSEHIDGKTRVLKKLKEGGRWQASDLYNGRHEHDLSKVSHSTFYRVIKELIGLKMVNKIENEGLNYYEYAGGANGKKEE